MTSHTTKHVGLTAFVLATALGCGASRVRYHPTAETSAGSTPRTPSRQAVVSAMSSVTDDVRSCARGIPGEAKVRVLFASSGTVTDVSIDPEYSWLAAEPGPGCDPTPDSSGNYSCRRAREPEPEVDACIVRVVRAARVPPFTQPSFSVNYPFRY